MELIDTLNLKKQKESEKAEILRKIEFLEKSAPIS